MILNPVTLWWRKFRPLLGCFHISTATTNSWLQNIKKIWLVNFTVLHKNEDVLFSCENTDLGVRKGISWWNFVSRPSHQVWSIAVCNMEGLRTIIFYQQRKRGEASLQTILRPFHVVFIQHLEARLFSGRMYLCFLGVQGQVDVRLNLLQSVITPPFCPPR